MERGKLRVKKKERKKEKEKTYVIKFFNTCFGNGDSNLGCTEWNYLWKFLIKKK